MFGDRLLKLREEMGKSKKEVADALHMPYNTYSNYEADLREPNSEVLIKIADFYETSIDYLLGLTKIKKIDVDLQATCRYTGLSEKAIKFIHSLVLGKSQNKANAKNELNALDVLLSSNAMEKFLMDLSLYLCVDFDSPEADCTFFVKVKGGNIGIDNGFLFSSKALEMAVICEMQDIIKELKTANTCLTIDDIEKGYEGDDGCIHFKSMDKKAEQWDELCKRFSTVEKDDPNSQNRPK